MNTLRQEFFRIIVSSSVVGLTTVLLSAMPAAPVATETKIRLLSEALHARDAGEITAARQSLEELLALGPTDETVKRLLAGLGERQANKVTVTGDPTVSRGTTSPLAASAGSAESEAERLAHQEEERVGKLLAAARTKLQDARALAKQTNFNAALGKIQNASASLPENSLTQELLAELELTRSVILQTRDQLVLKSAQTGAVAVAAGSDYPGTQLRPTGSKAISFPSHPLGGREQAVTGERRQTSEQMLEEVDRAWQRPGVSRDRALESGEISHPAALEQKLNSLLLPGVNFNGMELSRVVNALSMLTEELDAAGSVPRGVNIVMVDPAGANPLVSITLRNLPLKRVLDLITDSVGYQYEVQADAVVVRPGGTVAVLDTHFFPVSRSTVLRLTGRGGASAGGSTAAGTDRLAGGGPPATHGAEAEGREIRNFLQLAGVNFDSVPGSTLAFDGSQLIITQTPRNLGRIRNILNRYHEVRQVAIEAKFMEVQEGALEELGLQWSVSQKATPNSGPRSTYTTGGGIDRTLADAFKNTASSQQITISGTGVPSGELSLSTAAPSIPGGALLGTAAGPLANIHGIIGGFDVNAVVRALSQKSGTELLSAPKLTVLSGNPATITVAQELRYPQSYGQIQSQVGTGSNSGGGSAGVSITSGTPQEFTTRNVGVELRVTPTVEEDNHSISLDLNPKVTEFEGFVEYGGPSIAISGGTTVTVPPGFYQPIFSVREVTTKVTLWDGATLVMGGLAREDVKKVKDKVPVLGKLPMVGRLFRSHGESAQKRNLLIFVTASLVNPGGGLKNPPIGVVTGGSNFVNPVAPTTAVPRQPEQK